MELANNEKQLFIHRSLFISECGVEKLRDFLVRNNIFHHSIISGINNEELVVIEPTLAQRRFSLTDTAFQFFVNQKTMDGYLYGSLESFKIMVGLDN